MTTSAEMIKPWNIGRTPAFFILEKEVFRPIAAKAQTTRSLLAVFGQTLFYILLIISYQKFLESNLFYFRTAPFYNRKTFAFRRRQFLFWHFHMGVCGFPGYKYTNQRIWCWLNLQLCRISVAVRLK